MGMFSWAGIEPTYKIDEIMTADVCLTILKGIMLSYVEEMPL